MDANAKKVSITIIVILIGVIGGLWYIGNQKNEAKPKLEPINSLTASSTDLGFDIKTYTKGRDSLEQIVIDKLIAGASTSSLKVLPAKVILYNSTNLIISNNTSVAALKTYGQQIAGALASYNTEQINETALMLNALEEKNPIKVQSLLSIVDTNKQTVSNLLKISVPKTAITVHLNLVNNLNKNVSLLSDMSKILDNPYPALESASSYRVQKLNFYKAVDEINQFFKDNNIIFSPEEGTRVYLTS